MMRSSYYFDSMPRITIKWCQCHNKYILIVNFHFQAMNWCFLEFQRRNAQVSSNSNGISRNFVENLEKGMHIKTRGHRRNLPKIFLASSDAETKICAIKINTHSRTCTQNTVEKPLDGNIIVEPHEFMKTIPKIWCACVCWVLQNIL